MWRWLVHADVAQLGQDSAAGGLAALNSALGAADTAAASVANGTQQLITDVADQVQQAAGQAALALNSTGLPAKLLPGGGLLNPNSSTGAGEQRKASAAAAKTAPDGPAAALAALPAGVAAAVGLPAAGAATAAWAAAASSLPLAGAAAAAALLPAVLSMPVAVVPGRRLLQQAQVFPLQHRYHPVHTCRAALLKHEAPVFW